MSSSHKFSCNRRFAQPVSLNVKTYAIKYFLLSTFPAFGCSFFSTPILPCFRCTPFYTHYTHMPFSIVLIILSTIRHIRLWSVLLCQRNCFNDTGKHLFKCLYFLLYSFRFSLTYYGPVHSSEKIFSLYLCECVLGRLVLL